MSTTTPPRSDISVVVLNYNGRKWIRGCLDALRRQTVAAELIVVDNASTDGSREVIEREYPDVRLIVFQQNQGFAAGNNIGAAAAGGRLLAFLNNDTLPNDRWLEALRVPFSNTNIGLATSQIVYMDDPTIIDSAGDGYLRAGGGFKRLHGRPALLAGQSREVFGACGAAFMIRRELFESLGGFDADFFMVYEDVDLSYRARLGGATCVYVADAIVRHAGSGSLGRASAASVYYGQRNLEWTYLKNTPVLLLIGSALPHFLYVAAAAVRYARAGLFVPYLRGKRDALLSLPRVLAKRHAVQRTRRISVPQIWTMMDSGWIRLKRAEKRFDLARKR